jgi:hypothetical protein
LHNSLSPRARDKKYDKIHFPKIQFTVSTLSLASVVRCVPSVVFLGLQCGNVIELRVFPSPTNAVGIQEAQRTGSLAIVHADGLITFRPEIKIKKLPRSSKLDRSRGIKFCKKRK